MHTAGEQAQATIERRQLTLAPTPNPAPTHPILTAAAHSTRARHVAAHIITSKAQLETGVKK
eukprot:4177743-Pleurochrysis_carterae.AAC.4